MGDGGGEGEDGLGCLTPPFDRKVGGILRCYFPSNNENWKKYLREK
jgi:hypothetical protein